MTPTATLPTAMLRPPPRDRRWLVVRCAQVGVIFVLVVNFEVAVREQSASPAPADKAHAAPADHGDA